MTKKVNELESAVDEWQAAIDRMLTICDGMMKEDYKSAAVIAVLRKKLLKLKKEKRHGL